VNTLLERYTPSRSAARRAAAAALAPCLLMSALAAAQPYALPPAAVPPQGYAATAASADTVSAFVGSITQSPRFDRRFVARWRAPLCFAVQGLPAEEAGYVSGRLSQVAGWAGAPVAATGCDKGTYNFHVVFTLNADQAAKDWYARYRDLFDANATDSQVSAFLASRSPSAVRVWHSATLFRTDGTTVIPVDPGDPIEPIPDLYNTGSRLPSQAAVGLNFALIIIDGTRANGAGLAQLADYAAMAGLADLDLAANVSSVPTILRLFNEPAEARPSGLTAWDQTFLYALYHADDGSRNLRAQIVGAMTQNIAL